MFYSNQKACCILSNIELGYVIINGIGVLETIGHFDILTFRL